MEQNFEERPEDTIRRFAGELAKAEEYRRKYAYVAQLFDSLNVDPGDVILDMVLIARSQDPAQPGSVIHISATDDVDFSRQLGMLHESIVVMTHNYGEDGE